MGKSRGAKKQKVVRRPAKPAPVFHSRGSSLRQAPEWPLYECLITKDWQRPGEIVQALVARQSPAGTIAAGVFLIDLGCLGLKNGFVRLFDSAEEYRRKLRQLIEENQELLGTDLDLVAKVIREAIAYAQKLGFAPHPNSRRGMALLAGADPDACDIPVPLGDGTGRPFFIAGPYDDVREVLSRLERAVGRGGFDYVAPLAGDWDAFFSD